MTFAGMRLNNETWSPYCPYKYYITDLRENRCTFYSTFYEFTKESCLENVNEEMKMRSGTVKCTVLT